MVTAFAMRNFLKAAVGCLGMIAGCFSTGEAQDFGGMSFGEAGNFGPPQTSGSSKATVTSYGEASFVIVTELALPDHWHVYYKNPGTVGLPMEAALQPVPGFRVEGPFWQIPELGKGLVDFYGYSGKAKMAFRVTPEKDAPPEATFTTTMTWQMCAEQCAAPETKNFSVTLKRGDGQTAPDAAELTGNMAGLAAPDWAEGLKARISQEGKTVTLHLRTNGRPVPQDSVYFFCNQGEINPTTPQIFKKLDDSNYELSMQFNDTTDGLYPNNLPDADRGKPLTSLSGILRAGREGIIITADDRPFSGESQSTAAGTESAPEPSASIPAPPLMGLGEIMFFMFIGGIILNVMPCVFPVIGLKIMGFVQLGGGERKKVLAHSLTFVLGILISFWLITAILIALKANMFDWSAPAGPGVFSGDFWLGRGAEGVVNWAFWFENPWVNFCLLGLMLAMGLSMFGVFEIGVKATTMGNDLQHRKGYAGSFWSGALATVISTPCSAPFLGQAIGAAMLQPPLGIVLCLTMMGLGMSLPYIILGAFPVLTRYLPKPGAWMESFKQSMSFLMFGTAAYFLWIYMAFFDTENHPQDILFLFFGLVLFSMAFWVYGRWCPMYRSRKSRITGGIFSVIFLLAGLYYMLPPEGAAWFGRGSAPGAAESSSAAAPSLQEEGNIWIPWSPEAMQAALDGGKPVYVDFTARWCSTCQVNKASYTDEVLAAFKKYGIVMMKADKTRTNPAIDQELKNLGRTAVPVNALYLPGRKPAVTRELLSPAYLLEFLEKEIEFCVHHILHFTLA